MKVIKAEEAIRFFRTYGFRVDEEQVKEWVTESNKIANEAGACDHGAPITEEDLHQFNEYWMLKRTAYEEGIDDKTKIVRLLDEVAELGRKISKLETENDKLKLDLGIMPF